MRRPAIRPKFCRSWNITLSCRMGPNFNVSSPPIFVTEFSNINYILESLNIIYLWCKVKTFEVAKEINYCTSKRAYCRRKISRQNNEPLRYSLGILHFGHEHVPFALISTSIFCLCRENSAFTLFDLLWFVEELRNLFILLPNPETSPLKKKKWEKLTPIYSH